MAQAVLYKCIHIVILFYFRFVILVFHANSTSIQKNKQYILRTANSLKYFTMVYLNSFKGFNCEYNSYLLHKVTIIFKDYAML